MHPFLSDSRKLFCFLLAWQLAGLGLAAALVHAGLAGWGRALAFALPLSAVSAFGALSAYYVCRALPPGRRGAGRAIAVYCAATLLAGAAGLLLVKVWSGLFLLLTQQAAPGAGIDLPWFLLGAGLYLLSLLAHDIAVAFEQVREAGARATAMRALAREAELQMLRTQVNPHFLFNCLNSISALTAIDPAQARAMTLDLAAFFRATLTQATHDTVLLSEEIALCERYLALESRRYGDKLRYRIQADDAAQACRLPPLSLQPLLENAIKHGIGQCEEGGTIRVAAQADDRWLHLSIDNPVADAARAVEGGGVGLDNLRQRLRVMYDSRASLQWRRDEDSFRVELTLPRQGESTP